MRRVGRASFGIAIALLVASCAGGGKSVAPETAGLTVEQVASLTSLEQVDDYPLYTMHHYAPFPLAGPVAISAGGAESSMWGCSLFVALGDQQGGLFGRNFDWDYSPALLLFNHPDQGYDSVSSRNFRSNRGGGSR